MVISEKTLKKELDKLAMAVLKYNLFRDNNTTKRGDK